MDDVDDNYIWQRRVFHGIRNLKGKVPFPESVRIGVEFNAAVERRKKLDANLLTQSVLIEIWEFAQTVMTSEKYFLFEVMAFNFDLGLDLTDHKLCYHYAVRIYGNIKNKKLKPQDHKDVFVLPDDQLSEKLPKQSAVVLKKGQKATIHKEELYPLCKELGVCLAIGPSKSGKQKFHLDLLTNGLMLELFEFARVLSSTSTHIADALLEHNFGIQVDQIPKIVFKKRKAMDWTGASLLKKQTPQCANRDTMVGLLDNSYMCPLDFEADAKPALVNEDDGPVVESTTPTGTHSNIRKHSDEETQDADARRKLWLLRGSCSRQILIIKSQFESCREIGLAFDVCSGAKQALRLELLTNSVLMEVQQLAMAIHKSMACFLFDILERNFNIVLREDHSKRTLVMNLITKWNELLTHPDKNKFEFLNGSFCLPHIYNSGKDVEPKKCTSSPDMYPYPFCKKIGVDFWTAGGNKLPLSALTVGAVMEIFQIVGNLCGTTSELVKDILEHNFTLDLRSAGSEAARVLEKWRAAVFHKGPSIGKWFVRRPNTLPRDVWLKTPVFIQIKSEEDDGAEIPSNQERDVQFGEFCACNKIGLDLDVAYKLVPKRKLSLQQLTRGVLLEVHRYVQKNCPRYVPSLYRILDYNFELGYQNPRKVEFAWSLASQVISMARKRNRNENYLNKVFELPFHFPMSSPLRCKEEPQEELIHQLDPGDQDIVFVQKLKPVDIEVEIE
ncbi:uncharacterized protein LOC144036804 isoform X2 [Vanacampus margaritifer]